MSTEIKVWLCGPFGKMGSELINAIEEANDIVITGIISPEHVGKQCQINGQTKGETNSVALEAADSLETLAADNNLPNVIVDFTVAEAAYSNALFAAKNNVHFVSGTTGMNETQKDEIISAFNSSDSNAIIASNFSVGAVLMMHFAAEAASHFTHMEITETHHTQKIDSPSGTALTTQHMMAESSNKNADSIPIHSLRLPGAIAHQQVHLSSKGEILRIEHDANDRSCFMPGIILSIRRINSIKNTLFSIEPLLFSDEIS